jgi:hypothetical protein
VNVVVVLEFGEGEEIYPVILSLTDEKPKVLLEFLIDAFRLSISLRVVGCSGCDLNTE